jgi:hypothetical protein
MDFLVNITQMVTNCRCGKMTMLVLYAHGTVQSNSVAIVRLADVPALGGDGSTNGGEPKVQIVTLLLCKSAAQPARIPTPNPHPCGCVRSFSSESIRSRPAYVLRRFSRRRSAGIQDHALQAQECGRLEKEGVEEYIELQ